MMNKLVTVLGVAAVATLAGCKDPSYKPMTPSPSKYEVKTIEPVSCTCPPGTIHEVPCACGAADCRCLVATKPVVPSCKCAPGTKHTSPCTCGAPDCQCVVEVKPVVVPVRPVEPETTIYVVQNGDYLAKISKKYNVTINSIKRLNNLKSDTVRVGQKLKLPGKLDIVAPVAPAAAPKSPAQAKKGFAAYTGATKEYVVKSGDTLGSVAYGNGCNIRQLKQLNGLTSDVLKIGQKLKVPAAGAAVAPVAKKVVVQKINEPQSKVAPAGVVAPVETKKAEPAPAATSEADPAPAAEPTVDATAPAADATAPAADAGQTYVVQEGDDMTGVSIRFCVSASAIRELNNLSDDAQLTPGQIIKLPADAQQ